MNPRKVKVPVVKKWCYVVACPDECVEAAKEGQCPASCEQYEGIPRCCPSPPPPKTTTTPRTTTPRTTTSRTKTPRTTIPRTTTPRTTTPECPQKCIDAAKSGNCLPECKEYEGIPRCCPG